MRWRAHVQGSAGLMARPPRSACHGGGRLSLVEARKRSCPSRRYTTLSPACRGGRRAHATLPDQPGAGGAGRGIAGWRTADALLLGTLRGPSMQLGTLQKALHADAHAQRPLHAQQPSCSPTCGT